MALAAILLVRPLREHSLVQVQEDRVEGLHLSIEDALHVTVGAKRLFDVSDATAFRAKLAGLEVADVFVVVEHEANGGRVAVDLEGMTAEDDAFEDDSVGCAREKAAIADE
jgi:hypothetical protein